MPEMPGTEKTDFAVGELLLIGGRMGIPQTIMLALFAMNLGDAWYESKEEDAEGGEFLAQCISIAIWIVLLLWGGFFR